MMRSISRPPAEKRSAASALERSSSATPSLSHETLKCTETQRALTRCAPAHSRERRRPRLAALKNRAAIRKHIAAAAGILHHIRFHIRAEQGPASISP